MQQAEDWLYTEEGEDATKPVYVQRIDALHALADPVINRYKEAEQRTRVVSELRETLNNYLTQATSGEERFAHIEDKDKQTIVERVATIQKWLDDQIARQSERAKNVDPVLTSAEVLKRRDEVVYFASPIMGRPKPKPPKVDTPSGAGAETPKSGQQTPKPEEQPSQEAPKDNGPPEMDID